MSDYRSGFELRELWNIFKQSMSLIERKDKQKEFYCSYFIRRYICVCVLKKKQEKARGKQSQRSYIKLSNR